MDSECKKLRVSRLLLPGIFLVGLLLLGFPSRPVQAACDTGACPVCGDDVLCSNPDLCDPVEECESDNDCAADFHCDGCKCEPNPFCGDGTKDPGEACDGADSPEGCECVPGGEDFIHECECRQPLCGNGIVREPEECDEGGSCNDGSPCTVCDEFLRKVGDPLCAVQNAAACEVGSCSPGFGLCDANCELPVCGDGDTEGNEECDDGNDNDNDGCKNNCTLPDCGDGVKSSTEECDASSGVDNCDEGFQCVNAGEPGECTCKLCPQCGNGQLDAGEACDDGNNISGDTCENDCTLPVCGNGVVDEDEECDAASNNSNNGLCTEDCQLAFCGDGHILNGPDQVITEVCDDGNNIDGDGCSADCLTCPDIVCGNGRLDGSDECEAGHEDECGDGETCNTSTCRCEGPVADCGNGVIDPGEACEFVDGDSDNDVVEGSECDRNSCGLPNGTGAPDPCQCAECGNNVAADNTNMPEECDGTDDDACDDDGCDENCECNDDECPGEGNDDDRNRACTAEEEAGKKTTICHVPPGNPDNAHTLCIGDPAVDAHLRNHDGDALGPCPQECPAAGLTSGDGDGTGSSASAGGCSLITSEADVHMIVPLMSLMSVALSLFWVRRQVK